MSGGGRESGRNNPRRKTSCWDRCCPRRGRRGRAAYVEGARRVGNPAFSHANPMPHSRFRKPTTAAEPGVSLTVMRQSRGLDPANPLFKKTKPEANSGRQSAATVLAGAKKGKASVGARSMRGRGRSRAGAKPIPVGRRKSLSIFGGNVSARDSLHARELARMTLQRENSKGSDDGFLNRIVGNHGGSPQGVAVFQSVRTEMATAMVTLSRMHSAQPMTTNALRVGQSSSVVGAREAKSKATPGSLQYSRVVATTPKAFQQLVIKAINVGVAVSDLETITWSDDEAKQLANVRLIVQYAKAVSTSSLPGETQTKPGQGQPKPGAESGSSAAVLQEAVLADFAGGDVPARRCAKVRNCWNGMSTCSKVSTVIGVLLGVGALIVLTNGFINLGKSCNFFHFWALDGKCNHDDATPSPLPPGNFTESPSSTPSLTSSVTPTISLTPSLTPSISLSSTGTSTASVTATSAASSTPSISLTSTRTGTPSNSVTPVMSPTSSISLTSTRTGTPSNSVTPAMSPTPSISLTSTRTGSPSNSVTPAVSPTPSISLTPSISDTATSSVTPTISVTPSTSESASNTGTPSTSLSATSSPNPSASPTVTPSPVGIFVLTGDGTATLPVGTTGVKYFANNNYRVVADAAHQGAANWTMTFDRAGSGNCMDATNGYDVTPCQATCSVSFTDMTPAQINAELANYEGTTKTGITCQFTDQQRDVTLVRTDSEGTETFTGRYSFSLGSRRLLTEAKTAVTASAVRAASKSALALFWGSADKDTQGYRVAETIANHGSTIWTAYQNYQSAESSSGMKAVASTCVTVFAALAIEEAMVNSFGFERKEAQAYSHAISTGLQSIVKYSALLAVSSSLFAVVIAAPLLQQVAEKNGYIQLSQGIKAALGVAGAVATVASYMSADSWLTASSMLVTTAVSTVANQTFDAVHDVTFSTPMQKAAEHEIARPVSPGVAAAV